MKHPSEDQLVLYYYGEDAPESRKATAEHLAACESCQASYAAFRQVLATVKSVPVREPPENYEARVWEQLRPRLPVRSHPGWEVWLQPRRWAWAGAMAVLIIGAFLAGRYWQQRPSPQLAGLPAQARERILLVAVGDHLDRSQMLLIELEHADGKGPVDIGAEKMRAEDLVASNRLYRQAAARAGDPGLENVLDELERTLLQIAHSPSELTPAELERIQRRTEAQGILFKLRVIRSQVRDKEAQAARDVARRSL